MFFKINDVEWTVMELAGNSSMLTIENTQCAGTRHYFEKLICLNKDLKSDHKRKTLAHEFAHAFLFETQLENKETYTQENVCEFVALYGCAISKMCDQYFTKE